MSMSAHRNETDQRVATMLYVKIYQEVTNVNARQDFMVTRTHYAKNATVWSVNVSHHISLLVEIVS